MSSENFTSLERASATKKQFAAIGVTDASGNLVFNITAGGFTSIPVASLQVQAPAAPNVHEIKIISVTLTAVTVKVTVAVPVVVNTVSVLAEPVNASGVTIHLICQEAGAGN